MRSDRRLRCNIEGTATEMDFVSNFAGRFGLHMPEKSSKDEDMIDKVDWWFQEGGGTVGVDIKSRKKGCLDESITTILLEAYGVSGHGGWLCTKSKYLAFDSDEGFYMVPSIECRDAVVRLVGVPPTPTDLRHRGEQPKTLNRWIGRKMSEYSRGLDVFCYVAASELVRLCNGARFEQRFFNKENNDGI